MLRDLSTSEPPFPKWLLAKTFPLVAAMVGYFLGVGEGILLFSLRHARFPQPVAGRAVLILAPLVDALAFGLMGGVLGLGAEFWNRKHPHSASLLASFGLFIAGTYATYLPTHSIFLTGDYSRLVSVGVSLVGGLAVTFAARGAWLLLRRQPMTIAAGFWPRGRMLVRYVALTLGALLVGLVGAQIIVTTPGAHSRGSSEIVGKRPNLVMIVLDTGRADHFSGYGYSQPTTPNLDNLAKQGVLFETAVAPAPWTLPSFSTVFTGLLPHQNPTNWDMPLPDGSSTLASILRSHGYQTAGFNANYMVGTRRTGLAQGFDVYDDDDGSLGEDLMRINSSRVFWWLLYYPFIRPDSLARRNAGELNQSAFRWFRHRSQQPFFFLINYYDLHEPYSAAPGVGKKFGDGNRTLAQRIRAEIDRVPLVIEVPKSPAEQASLLAAYDGALNYTDRQIGALLRLFEASPEWSNTYFIVFSDHGQAFGEHRHYGHEWGLNWELLHVPLIIAGPGIPPGRRVTDPVSLQQIFATVMDLSGASGTLPQQSSLRCYWESPASTCDPNPLVISELDESPNDSEAEASISAVTPGWHFLRDSDGNPELYNLASDPHEKVNLAASPDYQEEVREIQRNVVGRVRASSLPWLGETYLTSLGESDFRLLTGKKFTHLSPPDRKLQTKTTKCFAVCPTSKGYPRTGFSQCPFVSVDDA